MVVVCAHWTFNPIPDYWSEDLSPEERSSWVGNPSVMGDNWDGVDAASIDRYLVTWDLENNDARKAYEDDEHPICDCWQLVDFMRRLGLTYPVDDRGQSLGEAYTFDVTTYQ